MSIEKSILTNLIADTAHIQKCIDKGVIDSFFLYDDTRKLFRIIVWHYSEYHKLLESDSLQVALQLSSSITPEQQSKLILLFEELKLLPKTSNFELLLEEFFKHHKTNFLKQTLDKAIDRMHDNNPDGVMETLKSGLGRIEQEITPNGKTWVTIGDVAKTLVSEYQDRKEYPEKYRGVLIGFPTFDRATNGLKKGSVTLIVGEMKSAKSVLAVNIAHNVVKSGRRVLYHANEGGEKLIIDRFVSCMSGLSLNGITHTRLTDPELIKYSDCCDALKNNTNLVIDCATPGQSKASHIDSKVREVKTSYENIDLIIVDYMGLMQPDQKGIDSDYLKWGQITTELMCVAQKYHIPMIVIVHANRKGMGEKKKRFDLEDIGLSIEPLKHVDMIVSWRIIDDDESFDKTKTGNGLLTVLGSRYSESPEVTLHINTNIMKIEEFALKIAY